jgi:hypothetical protein
MGLFPFPPILQDNTLCHPHCPVCGFWFAEEGAKNKSASFEKEALQTPTTNGSTMTASFCHHDQQGGWEEMNLNDEIRKIGTLRGCVVDDEEEENNTET